MDPNESLLKPQHPTVEHLEPSLAEALAALRQRIGAEEAVVVAYSGGVDSALVAAIAAEQRGALALAVTGVSPALAPHLREEAQLQAQWMGIAHRELGTAELQDPDYTSNPSDRCYACKRELHRVIAQLRQDLPSPWQSALVLDGVNLDDLGDHRPGIAAARERGVASPLAELGINKQGVRAISRALGFPWWDKPAQPCLASRFPYGEAISAERLQRVAAAETWLRQRGFQELRVRSQGESARIELPPSQLARLLESPLREDVVTAFGALGFSAVSLDLEGLVSGKLNRELQGAAGLRSAPPCAAG
ncbi:MAG: ATP-dependent sacrificial sulfur transferase LarE [Vulcanococcus sp.]